MELHIHRVDVTNREVIATWGPVLVRVFGGATDIPSVDYGCGMLESLLERWPMAGLLSIALHGTSFPDGPTRRHASRSFGAFGDRVVTVQCIVGLGFWAEAARATAMAIARMAGSDMYIEANVEAAAHRLALEMVGLDAEELIAAHDQMVAELDAALGQAPAAG